MTTVASFRPKQYMDSEYDYLWKQLGRLFRDGGFDGCTVIPYCPLSTFFDFKVLKSEDYSASEQDAVRYAHLAFACVDTHTPSAPKLIAAIVSASETRYVEGTLRVLRTKMGVQPIVWPADMSAHRLALAVQARIDEGIQPIDLAKCPATSWGEKEAAKLIQRALWLNVAALANFWKRAKAEGPKESQGHFKSALEDIKQRSVSAREQYWFWREAPLRRFIECAPAGLTAEEARLRDLWWVMSADLLITTRAPDYRPLLAIEYDGGHHDSEKQKSTDAKRNEIFRRAGIPLLRMRYNDLNGADPLVERRLHAAVGLIVERRLLEDREDVVSLNTQIARLMRRAIERATERGKFEPSAFTTDAHLTEREQGELLSLELELHGILREDEGWDIQQHEETAERDLGFRAVLKSVEAGEFGHVASVECSEIDGTPLSTITGETIRYIGAEGQSLRYAERQLAIGAAFDLAERVHGRR